MQINIMVTIYPGVTGIQQTIKKDWWFKKLDFYNYIGKKRRIGGGGYKPLLIKVMSKNVSGEGISNKIRINDFQ